jgi:uncharacterized membrane protein YwzB
VPKSKLPGQGRQFLTHVLPAIVRPLRTLWHEIIGFLFIALALWALPSAIRIFREFDGELASLARAAMVALFVLVMAGYGISSFLRARKISRS